MLKSKRTVFILVFFVFALLAWLSSGTLSMNAISCIKPYISDCGYLLTIDQNYHFSLYRYLQGAENISPLFLRRILYPTLTFPLTAYFQKLHISNFYIYAGFITNLFVYLITFIFLYRYIFKKFSMKAANYTLLFLASFPPVHYYSGIPYFRNIIVPATLAIFLFLFLINKSLKQNSEKNWQIGILSLLIGILYLGYDLYLFFFPASLFIALRYKKIKALFIISFFSSLPLFFWLFSLKLQGYNLINGNSAVYKKTLFAYFNLKNYENYFATILNFPISLFQNFFYCSYIFLPLLFLYCLFKYRKKLDFSSISILLSAFLFFAFVNLAPDFKAQFVMKGDWIARLYNPIFVIFLFYSVKCFNSTKSKKERIPFYLVIFFNTIIVLSPVLNFNSGNYIHTLFYKQTKMRHFAIKDNLDLWGRRPLGFCLSKAEKKERLVKHKTMVKKSFERLKEEKDSS